MRNLRKPEDLPKKMSDRSALLFDYICTAKGQSQSLVVCSHRYDVPVLNALLVELQLAVTLVFEWNRHVFVVVVVRRHRRLNSSSFVKLRVVVVTSTEESFGFVD